VPYDLFIKLPPHDKMLICEAQKAEPGYEQCKVNFHEIDIIIMDDLVPDIDKISGYQNEANTGDGYNGKIEVDDVQKILAHVTQYKVLPPSDIQHVLDTQQSQKTQELMQKNPRKTKNTIIIDGVVYTANIHNGVYFTIKHQANKQETSLVHCGANEDVASINVMVIKRGVNGIDNHFVQDLPICKNAIQVQCNKTPIIVIIHQFSYFGKGRTTLPNLQLLFKWMMLAMGIPQS